MTTVKLTIAAIIALAALSAPASAADTYVDGYYRSNGTYVQPHYRTAPNGNPYDNYNYPGNYNPNRGRSTGGTYSYPR